MSGNSQALAGKNILITGGCGFIGSHLVKRCLDAKASKIVVVDLVIEPYSYFLDEELDKQVTYERCNIINFEHIRSVITKHNINIVFHLAAQAIVDAAYYDPLGTINSNVIGTANVLEACRFFGKVESILVTSTDKAYGKLPRVSEKNPISGDHPYEVSKTSADLIVRSYYKTYKLPIVVTRFGNVYGEGDINFSRIIPGIMEALINKKVFEIRSDGKYVRDYVYVEDVIDATLTLTKNIKRVQGEAFNISSYENLSVIEVVEKVENILGEKIKYKILFNAINEIPKQSVNFNKIKGTLGWKPKNNFKKTIPGILAWYRNYFSNRNA